MVEVDQRTSIHELTGWTKAWRLARQPGKTGMSLSGEQAPWFKSCLHGAIQEETIGNSEGNRVSHIVPEEINFKEFKELEKAYEKFIGFLKSKNI